MKMKVIKPAKFNGKAITDGLVAGAGSIARDIETDLRDITQTWKHKPVFKVDVKATDKAITLDASTDDLVFIYLDKGTKVRHALMSRDWQSKTKPASGGKATLSSGRGRGRLVVVGRHINRPGIKARKFVSSILRSQQRDLLARMEKHLARGVKKSGHKA